MLITRPDNVVVVPYMWLRLLDTGGSGSGSQNFVSFYPTQWFSKMYNPA